MKKVLALIVICCMMMSILASCGLIDKIWGSCEHVDANGDHICDKCEEELEDHVPPSVKPCDKHKDEDGNLKCDVCGAELPKPQPPACTEHKDEDGDLKCDACGADLPKPQPPACTEHKDEDGDYKCDNCQYVMFEEVKYTLNISDLEAGKRSADDINGKFTIVSGTEVRNRTKTYEGVEYNKSIKIGGNANKVIVSVPGTGTLRFIIQNGSSGVDMQFTKVIAPDGTVQDIEFVAGAESNPLVMIEIEVTEGEWTITRGKNGGTQDIFYLELECVVAVAEESGFELVSAGQTDFFTNVELDTSGVRLNAVYANGKTDTLPLENVTIDTSKVDMTKAGKYPITITYKDYEPIAYNVIVYEPYSISIGFDAIEKLSSNTAAGNGVYFNHHLRSIYKLGEALDLRGLSVTIFGEGPSEDDLMLDLVTDYEVSAFDPNVLGPQTITVSYRDLSDSFVVYVVETEMAEGNQVMVDDDYAGEIGAIVDGYNMFATVNQALEFLERAPAAEQKLLVIAEGYYEEKLEVTIPNLTIRGAGADKTVIEWDSLYGLMDASQFTHTTDSTATVAIRESAVNCVIEDITISNYWNTQERMDEYGLAIERGLALLVQADRFIMKNSKLLGIQDTLELFTGRQYFENVFISGYTDFIFGTNNTTYFKNCTVHVIDTIKDDQGTAGYITAFKGSNKGESDAITYGAIFDGCKFTADEGVGGTAEKPAKTAIGRPWGVYAAVAVINSELGGHISTAGFTGAKNERYVSMTGKPTDATVQFVEYNNTGAGALTEAVAGMRMLTAEEAAMYANFEVIFGTTNRNVTYLDPWDPDSEEVVVDDRTYYYFNGATGTTGTYYTYNDNIQGATGTIGDIVIDATKGKVSARASDTQINAGAKLTFSVEAGTLVTVISYPGYGYYTINGIAHNANDTFSVYFAEATEVVIEATGTAYLYQIIINPNEEAPEAPELQQIKASGATLDYKVGDTLSLEGLEVKAHYSDYSIVTVTDYTVDASAIDMSVAGSYNLVITYGGQTVVLTVNVEDPNAGPEITDTTILDFSTPEGLEAAMNNSKVTIEGKVRHNGAEIQIEGTISFYVKAGTVVYIEPYNNSSYVAYTVGDGTEENLEVYHEMMAFMFDEDSLFVYTGLANNYLVSIEIIPPVEDGIYVFGGKQMDGDVVGILSSTNNITLEGTWKTHSGGAQLGKDSLMTFSVSSYTTVVIKGYDTSYGKLDVYVNDVQIDMDENACYVFTTGAEVAYVVLFASNQGTEEAPDWSKSYISYMTIESLDFIEESTTINFGSSGNYNDILDMSAASVRDNGGNNSQISAGSFSFAVRAGAKVTINGYPGYTSYTFNDGITTSEEITGELYEYIAENDCIITIAPVNSNNYLYSISVIYPVVFAETTTIDLSATGANIQGSKGEYNGLSIDATNGKFADNNGNWVQVNAGTIITLNVADGAQVSVSAYSSAANFTVEISGGVCTITCTGNDYLNGITVSFE